MALLILGLLILIGYQALYNVHDLRRALIARFGFASFAIASGVAILLALALIIEGKSSASYTTVWIPPATLQLYVMPAMFIGFVIAAAQFVPSNLRRWLPRPLMVGALIWFLVHLLVKTDLTSMTLFGGLAIFAAIGCFGEKRDEQKLPWLKESLPVAIGGVLYFVTFLIHGYLFGATPTMMGRGFF